ncbi:MAG: hypothetical protein U9O94_04405, partial [Nanoarchaeota archaeon]|nr:hypothetical protein [Nanoarchaeota archaeon]
TDDNCPLTYTFVNETAQTTSFKEVLLTDNTSVVFTTLIENDVNGYKGENQSDIHDFQMIVGEDGHQGSAGPTSYYFFVELG